MSFPTKQDFAMVPVADIHEHPRNPKVGDVNSIDESMDINGFFGAITVHRLTGDILAGNHTYRTAVAKGATEMPVIWFNGSEEDALRILLADNKTADGGEYDADRLDDILSSLPSLAGTGYGLAALEAEMEADEPDDIPAVAIPDDVYAPLFAVQIPCADEDDQQALFMELQAMFAGEREIRVLAL